MFFLNGLKNIKIILIISIIFSLIASIAIIIDNKKTKKAEISFVCSDHYMFRNKSRMFSSEIYLNYCNKFKKIIDDKYQNLNGASQYLNFIYLEPDNYSYLNNFGKLNEINFEKKKILSHLEKNDVNIKLLLNSISYSLSKANFMSTNQEKFIEEINRLKILEFLRKHHIDNIEFVTCFSELYTSIFKNNQHIQLFVIIINFVTLIIISLFVFYFFKQFIKKNNKLIYLLVLFVILNPINIFYFFNFYKEPFLILFFLGIIVNFTYLNYNSKNNFITLINSFFFLLILFLILLEIKDVYFLPSIFGLLISYLFLIYRKKSNFYKFFYIMKLLILTLFLVEVNNFYKLSPHNISNNRLVQFTKYISNIKLLQLSENKFLKKIISKSEINKERIEEEKFYRLDNAFIKKAKKENEIYQEQVFLLKKFQHYDCNSKTSNIQTIRVICKKINSILYRIYKLKLATTNENVETNEENSIKGYKFNGVNDVLKSIPIAFVKSQLMPFNLNSNIKIIILSIYKIILLFFSVIFIHKSLKSKNIFVLISGIVIFLPLLTTIDLISSNFFTYFRYVLPYNFYLNMIAILGFLTIFKNNDKYFHKFRS